MIVQKLLAIVNQGAAWVLWLLIALSVISVGIMIERATFYLARKLPGRDALAAPRR
jgi:biopolymer transport protein ExbB